MVCLGSKLIWDGNWFKLSLFCQDLIFNRKFLDDLSYNVYDDNGNKIDCIRFKYTSNLNNSKTNNMVRCINESTEDCLKELRDRYNY